MFVLEAVAWKTIVESNNLSLVSVGSWANLSKELATKLNLYIIVKPIVRLKSYCKWPCYHNSELMCKMYAILVNLEYHIKPFSDYYKSVAGHCIYC